MRKRRRIAAAILTAILTAALAAPAAAPAQTYGDRRVPLRAVADLDLRRYAGRWHAIARMPSWFERGCVGTTADYGLRPDGRITVVNTCRDRRSGRVRQVEGTAEVVGPGQLAVRFAAIPFVTGDYVVMHVSPAYDLAVVGEPRRRYAWVLARRPVLSAREWETALAVLVRNGYRPEALERVIQP
jgi:apolipoprotein D and lipocalin family protein